MSEGSGNSQLRLDRWRSGQVKDIFWEKVCFELNLPLENDFTTETEISGAIGIDALVTAGGSRLSRKSQTRRHKVDGMSAAIAALISSNTILVIDDFHYLSQELRTIVMRNVKGAVFNGLKPVLLSVTHRAFDAIKAETELTGRFTAITLPPWSYADLIQIPRAGFDALRIDCPQSFFQKLGDEAQESPFLMQKFCWELCFDNNVEKTSSIRRHRIPDTYDVEDMFVRIAQDADLPIYQQLVVGPQSRKIRTKRPLISGDQADIYEATLLSLAELGPRSNVSYDELRSTMSRILIDKVPQKHEITSALKHLSAISIKSGLETAIDWDETKREINVADPYLRFYLRWQVRTR